MSIAIDSRTLAVITDEPQPFYDKSCKGIRVVGDALGSLITALFYEVLSALSSLVCNQASHHYYKQLAEYNWDRSNHLGSYIYFGDSIINFSLNVTGKPCPLKQEDVNEFTQVQAFYGPQFDTMLKRSDSVLFPIERSRLSPVFSGICMGESIDFVSRVLKMSRSKHDMFEVVKRVSECYSEQGTEEAAITQMLGNAQNQDSSREEMVRFREQMTKEFSEKCELKREEIEQKQKDIRIRIGSTKEEVTNIIEEISQITRENTDFMEKEREGMLQKRADFDARFLLQRYQALANAYDVTLGLEKTIVDDTLTEEIAPEGFCQFIDQLAPGPYLVVLSGEESKKVGHAMAFIKESSERGYIFDPNWATLLAKSGPEQSSLLWYLSKNFYNKEGVTSMTFFSCKDRP